MIINYNGNLPTFKHWLSMDQESNKQIYYYRTHIEYVYNLIDVSGFLISSKVLSANDLDNQHLYLPVF